MMIKINIQYAGLHRVELKNHQYPLACTLTRARLYP